MFLNSKSKHLMWLILATLALFAGLCNHTRGPDHLNPTLLSSFEPGITATNTHKTRDEGACMHGLARGVRLTSVVRCQPSTTRDRPLVGFGARNEGRV